MEADVKLELYDVRRCRHYFYVYTLYDCQISSTYWTSPTFDAPVALFVGGGGVSYEFSVDNSLNTPEDPEHCGSFQCGIKEDNWICQDPDNYGGCEQFIFDAPDLMTFESDGVEPFNNWTLTFDNPSTSDAGSLAIRIECWMLDNYPNG